MIKPIVLYDNKLLRSKCSDILINKVSTHQLNEIIEDLFDTMNAAKGIGLAAPQIGALYNIFVIDIKLKDEYFRQEFINPTITKKWGDPEKDMEGCLSIPGIPVIVERQPNITIEFYDRERKKHTKDFSGFLSRAIQHEYDHLNGILTIDNIDSMWSKLIAPQLLEIKNKTIIKYIPYQTV